jgi:hypothetical protein
VTIHRAFEVDRSAPRFRMRDRLLGREIHRVEFFFHAAPGAEVRIISGDRAEIRWPDGVCARISRSGPEASWEIREGWFAPSYGIRVERPTLVASAELRLPAEMTWDLQAELLLAG